MTICAHRTSKDVQRIRKDMPDFKKMRYFRKRIYKDTKSNKIQTLQEQKSTSQYFCTSSFVYLRQFLFNHECISKLKNNYIDQPSSRVNNVQLFQKKCKTIKLLTMISAVISRFQSVFFDNMYAFYQQLRNVTLFDFLCITLDV